MKRILLASLLATTVITAQAQNVKTDAEKKDAEMQKTASMDLTKLPNGWKKAGNLLLGFNYTNQSFWQGASEPYNATFNGGLTYNATRKYGKTLWINDLNYIYASTATKSTEGEFRKSSDALQLSSMYAPQIKPRWFWAINADLRTQLFNGFDYGKRDANNNFTRNSSFLTPGFIRLGVGAMYTPNQHVRIYFSPLTANIALKLGEYVRNVEMAGVPAGETYKMGLGALLRTDYTNTFKTGTFLGDIAFKSRLDLFTNYLDRPFVITDLDWINSVGFNLTKYVGVAGQFNFRYYDAAIQRLQNQNLLGLSFSYKL